MCTNEHHCLFNPDTNPINSLVITSYPDVSSFRIARSTHYTLDLLSGRSARPVFLSDRSTPDESAGLSVS